MDGCSSMVRALEALASTWVRFPVVLFHITFLAYDYIELSMVIIICNKSMGALFQ